MGTECNFITKCNFIQHNYFLAKVSVFSKRKFSTKYILAECILKVEDPHTALLNNIVRGSYTRVSKYSLIVVYFSCGYSFVPSTPPDDSISKYV